MKRKYFAFKKDKCHPLKSESYRKIKDHISALFDKKQIKKGISIIVPRNVDSWSEVYLHPGNDDDGWEDETHDMFCKLVEEYPWETHGIASPKVIEILILSVKPAYRNIVRAMT